MTSYQAGISLNDEPVTERTIAERVCLDAGQQLDPTDEVDAAYGLWLVILSAPAERKLLRKRYLELDGEVADSIYHISIEMP